MLFRSDPRASHSPAAAFRAAIAGLLCAWLFSTALHAAESWTSYKNPRFGYTLSYPSSVFKPNRPAEDGGGQVFTTPDERAKIVVYGALNDEKFTPAEYRETILKQFSGYDAIDYSPKGKTWFVLSGYRGDQIYYQKVMFSCADRVINAFSITFPKAEKKFFEGLVEIMEDNFKPGIGEGCR
jgi:hypothetical protein